MEERRVCLEFICIKENKIIIIMNIFYFFGCFLCLCQSYFAQIIRENIHFHLHLNLVTA